MEAHAFQCQYCLSGFSGNRGLRRHVLNNCGVLKKKVKEDKKKQIQVSVEKATCALASTCRAEPIRFVNGRFKAKYDKKDVEARLLEVNIEVRQIFEELSRRRNLASVAPVTLHKQTTA